MGELADAPPDALDGLNLKPLKDLCKAEGSVGGAPGGCRRCSGCRRRWQSSMRMRFRCEPSLPVDVIGLIVLLLAPVL
jgi:hypothetical protein